MEDYIKQLKEQLSDKDLEYFKELAPSYQKNFALHAFSGKQEKTRLKNLEEVKGALELKCKNIFDYKKKVNPRKEIPKDLDDKSKIKLYFDKIENKDNKDKIDRLYFNLVDKFDNLNELYAWNQPMISMNGTFICAFSVAKNHFSIGFDDETLIHFKENFEEVGYTLLKKGIQIKWTQEIDINLLEKTIIFTMENKKDATGFWK